jgi:hypothetical protein
MSRYVGGKSPRLSDPAGQPITNSGGEFTGDLLINKDGAIHGDTPLSEANGGKSLVGLINQIENGLDVPGRIYVNKQGNDFNDGLSEKSAVASVRHAIYLANKYQAEGKEGYDYTSSTEGGVTIYVGTGRYTEILPLVIPHNVSIVGDELRRTVIAPNPAFPGGMAAQCLAAITDLKARAQAVVTNTDVTELQSNITQRLDVLHPATATEATTIGELFDVILDGMQGNNDPDQNNPARVAKNSSASTDANVINAYNLLLENKQFLQAEVGQYMVSTYSYTDTAKSERDAGLFIEAVASNLLYGGNDDILYYSEVYYKAQQGVAWDGTTVNNEEDIFHVNDGSICRNMTITGTIGAGFRLDPDGIITSKSPYIQNVTCFLPGGTGALIDGNDQAGGNDITRYSGGSMLFNDYTMINDDGVGVHARNNGRAECVSIFTYYCNPGFLAESGGELRALNCSSAYGEIGAKADGFDTSEIPLTASVDNTQNEAKIGRVIAGGDVGDLQTRQIQMQYAGETYTSATVELNESGSGTVVTPIFANQAVARIEMGTEVADKGSGIVTTSGNAQGGVANFGNTGDDSDDEHYVQLAASDGAADDYWNDYYVQIVEGTGTGMYGIIYDYDSTTKRAYVRGLDGSTVGWQRDVGEPETLDPTSKYEIVPVIELQGGNPVNPAFAIGVPSGTGSLEDIYIIDAGSGYSTVPTPVLLGNYSVAPNMTVTVKDGVIRKLRVDAGGVNNENVEGTITGNGFAEIPQQGGVLVVAGLSTEPKGGSVLTIQGNSTDFYVVTVTGWTQQDQKAAITISPSIPEVDSPLQGTSLSFRERYSKVRLTGHDFLNIGTGSILDTHTTGQAPDQNDETVALGGGRVFYTSTDQDGNFRVGNLFRVEQATGKATLDAESFDLAGLTSLTLGSVALTGFGATVTEFSTDGTLSGNSDNVLVTERAIRTYLNSQLGGGENNLAVNGLVAGNISLNGNTLSTTTGGDLIIDPEASGNIVHTQAPVADSHLTNKLYVDDKIRESLHTMFLNTDGSIDYERSYGKDAGTVTVPQDLTEFFIATDDVSINIDSNGHLQVTI